MIGDTKTIELTLQGGLAHLKLTGGGGNPIGAEFGREFREAAIALDESSEVRAVLLTADGPAFCVGGDIKEFLGLDDLSASVKSMTADYHAGLSKIFRMDAPVVAAVHGAAVGAGVALACLGDLVFAGTSSHFTMAYTGIGFSPDGASTYLLPRLIGARRFQELVLTNRRVSAEEAASIGLVTEVVDDDELFAKAQRVAEQLAKGATRAFGATRRLVLESSNASLETQLEWEARLLCDICRTEDVREGLTAFTEKRAPEFAGR